MLWSRLREADPIASYCAQQCISAHQPHSIHLPLHSISGLTQKNSFGYLNVFVFDIVVCYSTLLDLPGP